MLHRKIRTYELPDTDSTLMAAEPKVTYGRKEQQQRAVCFKLSGQYFARIGIIFQIQFYCFLHIILNLFHVIAHSNDRSIFDISTQILSCMFYNHFYCFSYYPLSILREQGAYLATLPDVFPFIKLSTSSTVTRLKSP